MLFNWSCFIFDILFICFHFIFNSCFGCIFRNNFFLLRFPFFHRNWCSFLNITRMNWNISCWISFQCYFWRIYFFYCFLYFCNIFSRSILLFLLLLFLCFFNNSNILLGFLFSLINRFFLIYFMCLFILSFALFSFILHILLFFSCNSIILWFWFLWNNNNIRNLIRVLDPNWFFCYSHI
jgi:hypothetical protein